MQSKRELTNLQSFVVTNQEDLTPLQRESLLRLYQPIIGPVSVSLYMTLLYTRNANKSGQKIINTHRNILEQMNIGLNHLSRALQKLEATDLVTTYYSSNSNEQIIYELKRPLEVEEFFNHPFYSVALFRQVGDLSYQRLLQDFEISEFDKTNYTDVSYDFEEVFQVRLDESLLEVQDLVEGKSLRSQYTKEEAVSDDSDFSYSKFLEYVISDGINHEELTLALKEEVLSLHKLYNLDEYELSQVVRLSYNQVTGRIEHDQLKRIAETRLVRLKEQESSQSVVSTFPKEYDEKSLNIRKQEIKANDPSIQEAEVEIILLSEQLPNELFLEKTKQAKGGFATGNEKHFIKVLLKTSDLKPEVINLLIYYILVIQKRDNIYRSELERLANEWQQAGITTPEKVIKHIRKERVKGSQKQKRKPYYSKKPRYQEVVPDWLKKEKEESQEQPKQAEEISQEEQSDLERRVQEQLRRLRQEGREKK